MWPKYGCRGLRSRASPPTGHAPAKIDTRIQHLRFIALVDTRELSDRLIAPGQIQTHEAISDNFYFRYPSNTIRRTCDPSIRLPLISILFRVRIRVRIIHRDAQAPERIIPGSFAIGAAIVANCAVVEPVQVYALTVDLLKRIAQVVRMIHVAGSVHGDGNAARFRLSTTSTG